MHLAAREPAALHAEQAQLAHVRLALVIDQPEQLGEAAGAREQQLHRQLLTQRTGSVGGRHEDEVVEILAPLLGDPVELAAGLCVRQHLLDQALGSVPVEHPVALAELELPEVAGDTLAVALERVPVDAFGMLGHPSEKGISDAGSVSHDPTSLPRLRSRTTPRSHRLAGVSRRGESFRNGKDPGSEYWRSAPPKGGSALQRAPRPDRCMASRRQARVLRYRVESESRQQDNIDVTDPPWQDERRGRTKPGAGLGGGDHGPTSARIGGTTDGRRRGARAVAARAVA